MEEGKRKVPPNSRLCSASPELSQPDLELKCGSLQHQRLSLCFLLPAPAGIQTSLKWVFGIWDPASLQKSLDCRVCSHGTIFTG